MVIFLDLVTTLLEMYPKERIQWNGKRFMYKDVPYLKQQKTSSKRNAQKQKNDK